MVAQIVHVRAVDERPTPLALGDRRQPGEELLLAEEAAVDRVLRVVRILQLLGAHDHVPHAEERAQPPGLLELARGIGLGVGRDQHRSPPSASLAARARNVESTPPENATTTLSIWRSKSSSRSYLTCAIYGSTRIRSWNAV
jgi:hypothetical protein